MIESKSAPFNSINVSGHRNQEKKKKTAATGINKKMSELKCTQTEGVGGCAEKSKTQTIDPKLASQRRKEHKTTNHKPQTTSNGRENKAEPQWIIAVPIVSMRPMSLYVETPLFHNKHINFKTSLNKVQKKSYSIPCLITWSEARSQEKKNSIRYTNIQRLKIRGHRKIIFLLFT